MLPVTKNQTWLPSLFNDFFGEEWMPLHRKQHTAPAVNIIEHEKEFRIEVAAPGMCKEDFSVRIEHDNHLVIALEKCSCDEKACNEKTEEHPQHEDEKKEPTYLRRDFSFNAFRQSFILPDNVDVTKIDATMKHGVLTISLPKKPLSKELTTARQIAIK